MPSSIRRRLSSLSGPKAIILCYVTALGLIAGLTTLAAWLVNQSLVVQDGDSALINISGRQRMLSQQTALYAEQLVHAASAEEAAKAENALRTAATLMRASHERLVARASQMSAPLYAAYFEGAAPLDTRVRSYLRDMDALLQDTQNSVTSGNANLIDARRTPKAGLLNDLDAIVSIYEAEAQAKLNDTKRLHTIIAISTLALLALEALFIFRPLARSIERRTRALAAANAQMTALAVSDTLTNLPNRHGFAERLNALTASGAGASGLAAIMQLDLDRFKNINDTLGHPVGDAVLREVGLRLRATLCDRSTTIARLGGDEFAVIAEGLASQQEAADIATKIISAIAEPMEVDQKHIRTNASVGVTLFPQDDCDPEQLLKNADLALYQAKANGRGTHCFFAPSMKDDIARRRHIADELRVAITEDQLKAFIQPIFSLRDGSLTGAECLIRWLHPERGVVPASEFIPVAEEFLMAAQVDRIILDQVLARLARWRRMGLEAPSLAVNVSPRQIRNESFASNLVEELDAAGLARDAIRIEIFESVLVDRGADAAAQTIRDMDRLGVNVVLDDFGTGYASLTHLLDMPVEALKIHRSFIRRLGEDPAADKIVSAVVSLAQSLGVATIAEGVETPEQFAYLQMRRCDQAQGFLLDAPMDLDSFEDLLTRGALALNVAAPGPRADAASNKAFAF